MRDVEHELHKRRFSRNLGTALALVLLVAILVSLTMVKLTHLKDHLPEVTTQ
ncbi:MAG: cytochrome C oxidase assembly protein [Deltaproteobacteria bacterium]